MLVVATTIKKVDTLVGPDVKLCLGKLRGAELGNLRSDFIMDGKEKVHSRLPRLREAFTVFGQVLFASLNAGGAGLGFVGLASGDLSVHYERCLRVFEQTDYRDKVVS